MKKPLLIQLIKYGTVGVINTLVTWVAYWVVMHLVFGIEDDESNVSSEVVGISNIVAYTMGLFCSFILNRSWTFKSHKKWARDFIKFGIVFFVCYISQLALVLLLNFHANADNIQFTLFNHESLIYAADIYFVIGNVFYTILNFICNKYYTFRK